MKSSSKFKTPRKGNDSALDFNSPEYGEDLKFS